VVAIVLSTCCFIAVLMGIAFFVWHSMRSSGAVMDEFHPVEVVPPMPAPTPAPAPQPPQPPRDATQKALKEATDVDFGWLFWGKSLKVGCWVKPHDENIKW